MAFALLDASKVMKLLRMLGAVDGRTEEELSSVQEDFERAFERKDLELFLCSFVSVINIKKQSVPKDLLDGKNSAEVTEVIRAVAGLKPADKLPGNNQKWGGVDVLLFWHGQENNIPGVPYCGKSSQKTPNADFAESVSLNDEWTSRKSSSGGSKTESTISFKMKNRQLCPTAEEDEMAERFERLHFTAPSEPGHESEFSDEAAPMRNNMWESVAAIDDGDHAPHVRTVVGIEQDKRYAIQVQDAEVKRRDEQLQKRVQREMKKKLGALQQRGPEAVEEPVDKQRVKKTVGPFYAEQVDIGEDENSPPHRFSEHAASPNSPWSGGFPQKEPMGKQTKPDAVSPLVIRRNTSLSPVAAAPTAREQPADPIANEGRGRVLAPPRKAVEKQIIDPVLQKTAASQASRTYPVLQQSAASQASRAYPVLQQSAAPEPTMFTSPVGKRAQYLGGWGLSPPRQPDWNSSPGPRFGASPLTPASLLRHNVLLQKKHK